MLEILQSNLLAGRLMIPPVEDWAEVYSIAEELSTQYTAEIGHRSFDVLHVATALYLKASLFMTLDVRQKELAKAVGLKVNR